MKVMTSECDDEWAFGCNRISSLTSDVDWVVSDCEDLLKEIEGRIEYQQRLLPCCHSSKDIEIAVSAIPSRQEEWERLENEREDLLSKGYEVGEEFDTIRRDVTRLKDTLENEGEMLVDDVWEEEMLEFKKYGVIPGTYIDKGDDVEIKLLD